VPRRILSGNFRNITACQGLTIKEVKAGHGEPWTVDLRGGSIQGIVGGLRMLNKTVNPLLVLIVLLCGAAAVQASPPIIYVDAAATGTADGSSWQNACKELQDALTAATNANKPVEIHVAAGTYKPRPATADRAGVENATFQLINGVTLKGGYAGSVAPDSDTRDIQLHATILSDEVVSPSKPVLLKHTVTASGTDATAVIDGVTITSRMDDALYFEKGSPTVANCVLNGDLTGRGGATLALTRCSFLGIRLQDCNCVMAECSGYSVGCTAGNITIKDCAFGGSLSAMDFHDCNCILIGSSVTGGGYPAIPSAIECTGGSSLSARDCTFTGINGPVIETPLFLANSLDLVNCSFTANGSLESAESLIRCGYMTARGCRFTANRSRYSSTIEAYGDVVLIDCEFIGNKDISYEGAVSATGNVIANGCIFAGNVGGTLPSRWSSVTKLSNCTFTGNRPGFNGLLPSRGLNFSLKQCIFWDDPASPSTATTSSSLVAMTCCDVRGGAPGFGNIDADPCFVDPGHWDPNGTPDNLDDDFWVAGDYHLKSQAGHWDANLEDWIYDDATSPCIDAGDPNAPVGDEPFPNGGYINIGAYGGTGEASRTYFGGPVCPAEMAGDINGDCKVDDLDMAILMQHWLMEGWEEPANKLPTIRLISPEEGAVITVPTPLVLRVDASDADGAVITVGYSLRCSHDDSIITISLGGDNASNGWEAKLLWSQLPSFVVDGVYTITATAVDDDGARAVSDPITVTLHPSSE
jgi:hypothetical protein